MSRPWPTITCAACGSTGPGRRNPGLCRRCYARSRHAQRVCTDCQQLRRHLAAGRCAGCYRRSRTRQQRCRACGQVRPIHFGDRCERCKHRARAHPGACRRCGQQATLHGRQCRRCTEHAGERVGSCADCCCWTWLLGGRCRPCRLFGWRRPTGPCPSCGRDLPLGAAGRCRACLAIGRATGTTPNAETGLQLWWGVGTPATVRPVPAGPPVAPPRHASLGQLRLSRTDRARPRAATGQAGRGRLDQRLRLPVQRQLLAELTAYGQARGWTPSTMVRARRSLSVLLTSHPTLGTQPLETAVVRDFLLQQRQVALRVVEFLTDHDLTVADPAGAADGWLVRRLAPLPDPIRAEVQAWIEVLRGRGPRPGRPRKPATIQGYLRALEAALADWSARYQSLRQVTAQDVAAQLDVVTGPTRLLVLAAMRSLFAALKARRVLFANPTAGQVGRHATPTPALELDPTLRAGLLGRLARPDQRLVVLLAGVHALRTAQICALALDAVDLVAGVLLVDGRPRHLDALTLAQARAWLELRRQRWPHTANPHLLVNRSTAGGTKPVERGFVHAVFQQLGATAHQLRVDRLLAEVHASGGDPLALTRLFGLSDPTAIRYCLELGPVGQRDPRQPTPTA